MSLIAAATAAKLFDVMADMARKLVRMEIAKGEAMSNIFVLIVDYDDPLTVQALRALKTDFGFDAVEDREGCRKILSVAVDRQVIDALAKTLPDMAAALKIPVAEDHVPTFVMAEGMVAPFPLSMASTVEASNSQGADTVRQRIDHLFKTYQRQVVDAAEGAVNQGWSLRETFGLIVDMTDPESRELVIALTPDDSRVASASVERLPVAAGVMDLEKVSGLAESAPGLERLIAKPVPEGKILTLVIVGKRIVPKYIHVSVTHRPADPLSVN
ncbi:MAG: hypothetical protein U9Q03_00425 [Patescibacteria group bacterium]|nr:hypothetical protein [Patescibacteria group bacterium]